MLVCSSVCSSGHKDDVFRGPCFAMGGGVYMLNGHESDGEALVVLRNG